MCVTETYNRVKSGNLSPSPREVRLGYSHQRGEPSSSSFQYPMVPSGCPFPPGQHRTGDNPPWPLT